jgi:hypothetical protein
MRPRQFPSVPGLASILTLKDCWILNFVKCPFFLKWLRWSWLVLLFVELRFEFRALHFISRCSTTWASKPTSFTLVIFQLGSHIFSSCLGIQYSYLHSFSIPGMTGLYHHALLLCWDGCHWHFAWAGLKLLLCEPLCLAMTLVFGLFSTHMVCYIDFNKEKKAEVSSIFGINPFWYIMSYV